MEKHRNSKKLYLASDNLNANNAKQFYEILRHAKAEHALKGIESVHTSKYASRLNAAEIEIGSLDRQCLNS
ncbi:MAG: transposase [Deltaproteobacteria bacterium]|nr:transposase [Deltaproteobacteria bacterium]